MSLARLAGEAPEIRGGCACQRKLRTTAQELREALAIERLGAGNHLATLAGMSLATHVVATYMTTDPITATAVTPVEEVAALLATRRISAVPLVDDRGSIVGVVSRSDLLRYRRHHAHLRDVTCDALMTQGPIVVEASTNLRDAARVMIEHRIHRVFVVDGGRLTGVLTTTDLTRAVDAAKVEAPIESVMTAPVVTIRVEQPLSLAMEWLDRAHITGLVVTENDWPVGVFTQEEALAARDVAADTPVGELHDAALICLPATTSLHRAAAQCARMGVRRIVVSKKHDFVGVVSGLDFAGVVARA